MTSNKNRLSSGMNIYDDAMRRYIAREMQRKIGENWFSERIISQLSGHRVYRLTDKLERETDDSTSSAGERVLEISDYPHVIRANPDIFPNLCSRHSSNVAKHGGLPLTWMHEVADWRNVHAHPPPTDLRTADVDRVLDAINRVLSLFDQAGVDQVRPLMSAPAKPKLLIRKAKRPNEQSISVQKEREQVQRDKALARSEHEAASHKLEEARQLSAVTRTELRRIEQLRENVEQSTRRAKQQLNLAREQSNVALHERRMQHYSASGITQYRREFKKARSGNGWTYASTLGDWQVRRWVGQVQGTMRACVFAPGKLSTSGRTNSQQDPLFKRQVENEEDGFAWLYELEQKNLIEKRARQSVTEFESNAKDPNTEEEFDDFVPF